MTNVRRIRYFCTVKSIAEMARRATAEKKTAHSLPIGKERFAFDGWQLLIFNCPSRNLPTRIAARFAGDSRSACESHICSFYIEKLLQLQIADQEIRKLQEEIAELPRRIAVIEKN